jgi:cyclopropane-fatty-acyl-phospholipid synthase
LALSPIALAERDLLPDAVVRHGIRRRLRQRLADLGGAAPDATRHALEQFVALMDAAPIAPLANKANEQHYEIDAEFFDAVLGPQRKYSCCYWDASTAALRDAEQQALRITGEHARLADGQQVLELGCGWGSLTLWIARHFPNSHVTAVSNSASQRAFIMQQAQRAGLANVTVIRADVSEFDTALRFDRVVSVEMFEHLRNWRALLRRIGVWLKPQGLFFMHVFCHRTTPYEFLDQDPSDWMTRFFFAGGMMPADALAARFQDDLRLLDQWRWNGQHYERTLNAWLANMDAQRARVMPILARVYGESAAPTWWVRWRIFFMACAELFGYRDGEEWWVSHYLFQRPTA